MTRSGKHTRTGMPIETWEAIDRLAESMDIDTLPALCALVEGAFAAGQANRLVDRGLRGKRPSRRQRPRLTWVSEGGGKAAPGEPTRPAVWRYGPWTLARRGLSRQRAAPGDGWYLTGPSCDPACFLGLDRDLAQVEAESIIRRFEAEHAAIIAELSPDDLDAIRVEPEVES